MNAMNHDFHRRFVPLEWRAPADAASTPPMEALLDVAREAGFAEGLAAGRAETADAAQRELTALAARVAHELNELRAALATRRDARIADMARLAAAAGELLAGAAPASMPEAARALVAAALAEQVAPDQLRLRVPTAHAAALAALLPDLLVEGDAALASADLRLQLGDGEVAFLAEDRARALRDALAHAFGNSSGAAA